MEYLAAHPSFKIKYRIGMKLVDLLSRYADADWGNSFPQVDVWHDHAVQQVADHVEVEDAEDDCALDCAGLVLLCIGCRLRGLVPHRPSAPTRIWAEEAYPDLRGQHCVY